MITSTRNSSQSVVTKALATSRSSLLFASKQSLTSFQVKAASNGSGEFPTASAKNLDAQRRNEVTWAQRAEPFFCEFLMLAVL